MSKLGPLLAMANPVRSPSSPETSRRNATAKRQKLANHHRDNHRSNRHEEQELSHQQLIPGLPDHIAQLCLSLVHPSLLYSVCHLWRRLIYSPSFPPFLSLYTILSPAASRDNCVQSGDSSSVQFFSFDPISFRWNALPPPPSEPPLRLLLRHPSFISHQFPVQSVSACGNLILLAATTHNFSAALGRPLIFDPSARTWEFGPPLPTPRRWCVAGTVHGSVYVASGIGSHFSAHVAKLVERWDLCDKRSPLSLKTTTARAAGCANYLTGKNCNKNDNKKGSCKWKWEKVKGLKDGRFCREAIDAVGWRGKLCMVNVKGDAAKEGAVYDIEKDAWEAMPDGMLAGWKGPAAAMDEEVMYVVDEAKGVLKKYDPGKDKWEHLMQSDRLRGAQQIAAGGGRVCVVRGGGPDGGIVVLDVVAQPVKLWVVDTPPGLEALAVHILPRMNPIQR